MTVMGTETATRAVRLPDDMPGTAANFAPPAFILSFANRDDLADAVMRSGWRPIAARRADGAPARFLASGASIAVVDGRLDFPESIEAMRSLNGPAQTNHAALLALVPDAAAVTLEAAYDAGATHVLAPPFDQDVLGIHLRFAARHADRLAGSRLAAHAVEAPHDSWRWHPGAGYGGGTVIVAPGPNLASDTSPRAMLRRLDAPGRRAAIEALRRIRATGRPTAFAHDAADGRRLVHHLTIADGTDVVFGQIEELTSGPRAEPRGDALTGLADGTGARAWIAARLVDAAEPGCVVMIVGINRFDMLNAAFGRSVGDSLLQGVARRIERLAANDRAGQRMIARLASSEFLVGMAAPAGPDDARFLAGQIAESIARPFAAGEHVVTLGCRIGIAASAPGDRASADLLRRASAALAEAMAADGDAIRMLESEGEAVAERDARLEVDLRRALARDEIDILFQPQVDITSNAVTGVEALARWHHPVLGELGAATLFSVAERSDYLAALSGHVQRKALAMAAAWPERLAKLRLAVNVTAADMVRPDFAATLLAAADEAGFARSRLTVEVTESGLIEDLRAAAGLLAELRAGGVRVAIDDFGTGYSSLAYLKSLPLDYLKIDRRMSQDITGTTRDRVVVQSVIGMAKSLGLSVIAEGVETARQLELLAAQGCNSYQGFLCAPPLDMAALTRLVTRWQRR
ncbi:putative bifunctional diguanylate cyclase/phosphodiesterase [Sphingomonas arantia]|uniref:Bifunctional diguanylate cyclase/phosphodiesterase n=1 Tax=Sphingomonas arantia TaxID=1460676 RepID=A0ABW4TWK0_9SPHN